MEEIIQCGSGKVMESRELRTVVFSEQMDRLFTDGLIPALMSTTLSLKKLRKSSHLESDTSKQAVGVQEVTGVNTLKSTLGL